MIRFLVDKGRTLDSRDRVDVRDEGVKRGTFDLVEPLWWVEGGRDSGRLYGRTENTFQFTTKMEWLRSDWFGQSLMVRKDGEQWRGLCVYVTWRSVDDENDVEGLKEFEDRLRSALAVGARYRGLVRVVPSDDRVSHEYHVLSSTVGEATLDSIRRSFAFKPGNLTVKPPPEGNSRHEATEAMSDFCQRISGRWTQGCWSFSGTLPFEGEVDRSRSRSGDLGR